MASIYRAEGRDQAAALANGTTFGLSHLDAGAVFVNGMTASYPELPFGGVKDSGVGRAIIARLQCVDDTAGLTRCLVHPL